MSPTPRTHRLRRLRSAVVLAALALPLPAQRPLEITGVPEDAPFSAAAKVTPNRLVIDLALQRGWHVYAKDVGGGEPLRVQIGAASGLRAKGALQLPADEGGKLTGKVRIVQGLAAGKPGAPFRATLTFMVCDPLQCLPPIELTLQGATPPTVAAALSVLLVVGEKDEHSQRVAAFLGSRGFKSQVTTYAEVDSSACDGCDVVLADSKLFRANRAARGHVARFPKTSTPIVAVGFLGTELIEAHGLAMTSGYI